MFRRNIISKLEAWKQDKKHKPLILRGARQVGKTTVVNEFGSQFDNYLYFNLERNENAKLFEMEIPLDDLVNMLYASVGKVKKEGTTLVFIDEIQITLVFVVHSVRKQGRSIGNVPSLIRSRNI